MNPAAIVMLAFLGTTLVVVIGAIGLYWLAFGDSQAVEKRLDRMMDQSAPNQRQILELLKKKKDSEKYPIFSTFPPLLNLPLLFEQAGIESSVPSWITMSCVMGVVATVGMWAVSQHVIYALLAGMGFITLRYSLVIRRRQIRMTKFEELFAQSLEIIGRSLRAGHPFSMGLYMVSTEMPDPVGTEFGIVFQQNQMGLPMEDALTCLAVRVPILDVRFFILTVMIHQQTGGDLAEVLDNLSGVIRDRFKIQGQVRALTAEGRLSGWVLSLLPVFVFCIILIMNRDYVMVLLTTELGNKMIYSAVGLQIIGMLLIRKIVNIKV